MVLLQRPDQVLEFGADPVAGGHLAEADAQGGDLAGEVLGVRDRPLVLFAVLFEVDPVAVVLAVLGEQDQGAAYEACSDSIRVRKMNG